MDTPKQASYRIEQVVLTFSHFTRRSDIQFDGIDIKNDVQVNTEASVTVDDEFSVGVSVTLKSIQSDVTVFEIEATMVGVFKRLGESDLAEDSFKKINAPAIIFPFLREHIANTCLKGGLGNVVLQPINFKG